MSKPTFEDYQRRFAIGDLVITPLGVCGLVRGHSQLDQNTYCIEIKFRYRRWVRVDHDVWVVERRSQHWFKNYQLRPASLLDELAYAAG